jgi:hypothetical protein
MESTLTELLDRTDLNHLTLAEVFELAQAEARQ